MGYREDAKAAAKALVGKRIEIPVHYDMWMRGARFGVVTKAGRDGEWVYVQLDAVPHFRLKLWRIDYDYIKIIGDA